MPITFEVWPWGELDTVIGRRRFTFGKRNKKLYSFVWGSRDTAGVLG
jgi:hypothetical protein